MGKSAAPYASLKAVYVRGKLSVDTSGLPIRLSLTVPEVAILLCPPLLLLISIQFYATEEYPGTIRKSPYEG